MLNRLVRLLGIAGSLACFAQEYEIGGSGGYGFYRNATITRGTSEADAGFGSGFAASIFAGHQMHGPLGGEVRYVYRNNDLRLKSAGQKVTFDGRSHILHYDALLTGGSRESRFRPYIAFGGGIKVYQGTGIEQEFQPLGQFAALTRTHEWVPLISVGAGVRFRILRHAFLRFDVRDYLTPFPTEVIAPAQGAAVKGWLHDITPMVGISVFF